MKSSWNSAFYSLIIPHYNTPDLLRRCLNSIPQRADLQVIVVDDHSDATYSASLQEVQADFPTVCFIQADKHGGGGFARNIGLQYAAGDYILFADADDFFAECFNDILDEYRTEESDVVFFNTYSVDSQTLLPSSRAFQVNRIHTRYDSSPRKATLCFRYLWGEPWGKLIRHKLLKDNQIQFDELPIHNDAHFSYRVGFKAQSIKVDHRKIYCITSRIGSISRSFAEETQRIRIKVFAEKNRFLADHGIKAFDEIMLWPFKYYIKQRDKEQLKQCFRLARSYGYTRFDILWLLMKKKVFRLNNTNWCKA